MSKYPVSVPFVCRKSTNTIPDLTPVISNLSVTSSPVGVYTVVYIYGNQFSLYGNTGTSVVNFGSFSDLPVSFYSSQEISFSVPLNAAVGNYQVSVVNQKYPNFLVSNFVNYTVVND